MTLTKKRQDAFYVMLRYFYDLMAELKISYTEYRNSVTNLAYLFETDPDMFT